MCPEIKIQSQHTVSKQAHLPRLPVALYPDLIFKPYRTSHHSDHAEPQFQVCLHIHVHVRMSAVIRA